MGIFFCIHKQLSPYVLLGTIALGSDFPVKYRRKGARASLKYAAYRHVCHLNKFTRGADGLVHKPEKTRTAGRVGWGGGWGWGGGRYDPLVFRTRCPGTSQLNLLQNLTKSMQVKGAKGNMEAYGCN